MCGVCLSWVCFCGCFDVYMNVFAGVLFLIFVFYGCFMEFPGD